MLNFPPKVKGVDKWETFEGQNTNDLAKETFNCVRSCGYEIMSGYGNLSLS